MTNNYFCPLPWISFYIGANGHRRLCCNSQIIDNSYFKESDIINKTKRSLVTINKPDICHHCWELENTHIVNSYRESIVEKYPNIKSSYAKKIITSQKQYIPFIFELRLGDTCNLACRTCGPFNSSGWYKEQFLQDPSFITHDNLQTSIIKENNKYSIPKRWQWFEDKSCWPIIKDLLSNSIKHNGHCYIKLQGGEPFLQTSHHLFLEYIQDISKDIILQYTSNATIFPIELISIWKNFKSIDISVSIDGVGNINNYIRYPSNFNALENNILKLKEITYINLTILNTITTYSCLYLDQLCKWIEKNNLILSCNFAYNINDSIFSPLCMNRNLLLKSSEKLSKVNNLPDTLKNVSNVFNSFLPKNNKINEFWEFNNRIDLYRNQNIIDYLPELREVLIV